jgi:hypothetical protein
METGSTTCDRSDVLFTLLDAVLRETASEGGKLIERLRDEADMTIATFPKTSRTKGGGMGCCSAGSFGNPKDDGACNGGPVIRQRLCRRSVFGAALPLADVSAWRTALTIDVLRAATESEVPTQMAHRVTGSDLRSQLHRARQWRDVAKRSSPV